MKQHFFIKGMTCQHCRQAAERALSEVPGVQSAGVDLDSQSGWVEGSAEVDRLREAVEEAGFELLTASE